MAWLEQLQKQAEEAAGNMQANVPGQPGQVNTLPSWNAMPETTIAEIDAKILAGTNFYNTINAWQYKDANANATLAAISAGIPNLQAKKTTFQKQSDLDKLTEALKPQPEEPELAEARKKLLAGLSPEDVSKWYGLVGQMQAPEEKRATEALKQTFVGQGRYYGGQSAAQQRDLMNRILQTRYQSALGIAQQQQGVQAGAIGLGQDWAKTLTQRAILPATTR